MRKILGRAGAATVAGALAATTLLGAAPAHAATTYYDITGVIDNYDGSASGVEIIACKTDCSADGATVDDYTFMSTTTKTFTLEVPSTGTFALAVAYVDLEPGYKQSDGAFAPDGYLNLASGATKYSTDGTFANAKKVTVTASAATTPVNVGTITLGQAIHNPQGTFTQVTPGTIAGEPCAGHPTTFTPSPFSDLPSNATVTYTWYVGTSEDTAQAIPGATGITYTPTAAQAGQSLWWGMRASAPGRVAWDASGYLGDIGNPSTCVAPPAPLPSAPVKSFGKKSGKAKVGAKVRIKGAAAGAGAHVSYTWRANGKVVGHGASLKVKKSLRKKKLVATVSVSAAGHSTQSRSFSFGKVK